MRLRESVDSIGRRCCIERPIVIRRLPGFVRVIKLHFPEDLQSIRAQILLINNSLVTDDEGLHSGDAIFRRSSSESEASDHCSLNNKIYLAKRSRGTLPFQNLEVISVVWLGLIRVALLQGIRDVLG